MIAKGTEKKVMWVNSSFNRACQKYKAAESTVTESKTVTIPYTTEYLSDANRYTDEESVVQKGETGSQISFIVSTKRLMAKNRGEPISTNTEIVKEPVWKLAGAIKSN